MMKAFLGFLTARLLSLSSFSMVIVFYLICVKAAFLDDEPFWGNSFVKVFILLFTAIVFARFMIFLVKKTIKTMDSTEVVRIRPIESVAMPTYIGLFVVSLGIIDFGYDLSAIILALLFVFWGFFERVFYFNPIWIIFGYRFYEIESGGNNTFTLVTKQRDLKKSFKMNNLRRINNYTFMEII